MNWETVPEEFHFAHFERVEPEKNARRFYVIGWQPTLFNQGAVVRMFGRKGESQRLVYTAFSTFDDAWPLIRKLAKTRLRHRYRLVTAQ